MRNMIYFIIYKSCGFITPDGNFVFPGEFSTPSSGLLFEMNHKF